MPDFIDTAAVKELLEYVRKEEREVEFLQEHYASHDNEHMRVYCKGQTKAFKYIGDAIHRILLDAEEDSK